MFFDAGASSWRIIFADVRRLGGAGLCSYLLIGYYIKTILAGDAPQKKKKKRFRMNRTGAF